MGSSQIFAERDGERTDMKKENKNMRKVRWWGRGQLVTKKKIFDTMLKVINSIFV